MDELKQNILDYLYGRYNKTLWPFTPYILLTEKFGSETMKALLSLFDEGKIKFNNSMNGKLIQYIPQPK